ncbi:MAG: carbamoyl phosphate synthase large subunit [Deltaproteobacteria bacterium GWA2_65_63]|uniref:Carbamoyl phosphate synthase large chain n=1 Tax=uncultured delta proteobacterium Rifle_16ft_4_minimus_184 TaxID=1665175 RepID=A0A0H4T1D9_9DELT|nr:carbamoyl-phosphate synthase large subunit, carbamoyl-phosphate synthase large subunit [uncultured delta proteobacterium Rifle_16ft_4_minimus_184]OGP20684.1 MAG: carbamoyl phosphate synthase large subunit [Deltaproteobacteria bacterium GWA2_65_63]
MPRRADLKKIMLIGSGPIIIGQACEFDYSGTQACKALREEGYEVVLVNSNPATIMTDTDFADRTYIEPITPEIVGKIIERERPDALLPTIGGQTGLNIAVSLHEMGILQKYGVELIGASFDAIQKAEDRNLFRKAMEKLGLTVPRSGYIRSLEEALQVIPAIGYPAIIRPSFTLGGTGAGIAYNREEYEEGIRWALDASPKRTVLVEQSVIGWKEFELEVMRDLADNVVIVCSIENLDPMGVHTGDSITVAPAQTLTDKEYQIMRNAALRIIREIGVDTGGSNIQFAVHPDTGEMVIIEMNPRVSRSSALASKATGFPIAKIAAKLAVGYTLDEIRNDITRETPASFEPTIDYVVTKIPRFTFEKFPQTEDVLGTQMKSVGEVMAIGRTFKESLQKAIRSLETGVYGFEEMLPPRDAAKPSTRAKTIEEKLRKPNSMRLFYIGEAFREGWSVAEIKEFTGIDPWFLENIRQIIEMEGEIRERAGAFRKEAASLPAAWTPFLRRMKENGFSDRRLAKILGVGEDDVRRVRYAAGVRAVFKRVDTCGAEFEAYTPYLYSTYDRENEANPTGRKKVVILGGGPNRIGQGIEFDYCCVHGVFALREEGFETIMVNCNPETVSTDYDTSDRLYFEPLTKEDVLAILEEEKPVGVIVQFGGQTPLKLAVPLEKEGVRILGTSPESIDRAEDRERFAEMLTRLGLSQPPNGIARSTPEAVEIAARIGYPVLLRPSYVLGGRAMEIVHDEEGLRKYLAEAVSASETKPVLVDRFLEDAIEIDVDAISDGETVVVGGIMEHIEEAGVHSGDSACSLPPHSIPRETIAEIARQTKALAAELSVVGLMNVQFAIQRGKIFILEVNPRASRTVPFVSKAIGVPLAKLAAKVMAGRKLADLGFTSEVVPEHVCVKEAVFPFIKFPDVDTLLGPEMKSTGEVMGIDRKFGTAFGKAQIAAGMILPRSGKVFVSVRDEDKRGVLAAAGTLKRCGFSLAATRGTAAFLSANGVPCDTVRKVNEGRPHVADLIRNGEIALVINTPLGAQSKADSYYIRRASLVYNVPYFTTLAAARAVSLAIEELIGDELSVRSLQEYHGTTRPTGR